MDWDKIPEAFINRENFIRLIKEAQAYRRQRNIFCAIAAFGAFVCLITLFPV